MQRTKRQWTHREIVRILHNNGYYSSGKNKSSHKKYTNGKNTISVPWAKQNPMLINRLIKENDLGNSV